MLWFVSSFYLHCIACAWVSGGAVDCTLALLNVHACIARAVESLLHFDGVWRGVGECTVILLNQLSAQVNEYFALMTGKMCIVSTWYLALVR